MDGKTFMIAGGGACAKWQNVPCFCMTSVAFVSKIPSTKVGGKTLTQELDNDL